MEELTPWEATWEDFVALNMRFPSFHLEDKVAVWARGNAGTPHVITNKLLTYSRRGTKGKKGSSQDGGGQKSK